MTRPIRSWVIFAAGALVILSLSSCFDPDEDRPKPRTTPPPWPPATYQDLTQKDHVLYNLARSYNEMNLTRYAELLDDLHFIFFFSEEDFAQGKTPEQWGRSDDLASHQRMFNQNNPNPRTLSIKLTLQYPVGQWVEITPDQGQFPGETWYFKSVTYNLTLLAKGEPENFTYMAQNLKALFTVRQIEKNGKKIWQIVEWRDDVATTARSSAQSTAGPQGTSWGQIKSVYGG